MPESLSFRTPNGHLGADGLHAQQLAIEEAAKELQRLAKEQARQHAEGSHLLDSWELPEGLPKNISGDTRERTKLACAEGAD